MSRLGNGKGLLIAGIIIVVGFGMVILISGNLAANASNWYNAQDSLLVNEYNAGNIGVDELGERRYQNDMTRDWMAAQVYTVAPIATVGLYIGFLLLFLGLVVFATEGGVDEQTRRILLTIAGIMLFVLLLHFTGSLTVTIT